MPPGSFLEFQGNGVRDLNSLLKQADQFVCFV